MFLLPCMCQQLSLQFWCSKFSAVTHFYSMLAVLILSLSLVNQVLGYWIFGEVVCGLWLLMDITICTTSILHLCAISVDRYIAICHPLRYHQLMTKTRSRFICLGLWLLAFLCTMPVIIWRESSLLRKSFKITNFNTARDRKSTRLNSSHVKRSRMPSSAWKKKKTKTKKKKKHNQHKIKNKIYTQIRLHDTILR